GAIARAPRGRPLNYLPTPRAWPILSRTLTAHLPRIPMDDSRAEQTVRRLRWVLIGLVLAWLGCEAAAPLFGVDGPLQLAAVNLIIQPHLPIALGGMVVFYFCSRPADGEPMRMMILGTILSLGFKILDLLEDWETPWMSCICFGYGVSSLLMLGLRS